MRLSGLVPENHCAFRTAAQCFAEIAGNELFWPTV